VYKYLDTYIEEQFIKYDSVNKASFNTDIARSSIDRYLNTNVPTKSLLFYSKPITDFLLTLNLVKEASLNLNLDSNTAKEV
jgi:hypothetical protein